MVAWYLKELQQVVACYLRESQQVCANASCQNPVSEQSQMSEVEAVEYGAGVASWYCLY